MGTQGSNLMAMFWAQQNAVGPVYIYTVSLGTELPSAAGDYYDSGQTTTIDGVTYPVYTNGTCYLFRQGVNAPWGIGTTVADYSGHYWHVAGPTSMTDPIGRYEPLDAYSSDYVIVSAYASS